MTRWTPVRRAVLITLLSSLAFSGCSVARDASRPRPSLATPTTPAPTVIAPPQAEGLDGTRGSPPPNACTIVAGSLSAQLGGKVVARPRSWNDGGLPALDLCTLLVSGRPTVVGVSALPSQPDSLDRLALGLASPPAGSASAPAFDRLPELSPDARVGPLGVVFGADDRAIRVTAAGGLDRAAALTIGRAVQAVVPKVVRPARQSDPACQPAGPTAERFLGARAQLRRDYRVDGALNCIWGMYDATVSIVESFRQDAILEARRTPPPRLAPIGQPGYYLPEEGELVFRQGRRVVRVTALTNPSRPSSLDSLIDIVEPIMPLFIR
jgi:hypothetical protein